MDTAASTGEIILGLIVVLWGVVVVIAAIYIVSNLVVGRDKEDLGTFDIEGSHYGGDYEDAIEDEDTNKW